MSNPFRRWNQGDPFVPSASQMNVWTQAAEVTLRAGTNLSSQSREIPTWGVLAHVKNSSGADVGRYGILQISGSVWDPGDAFKETPCFVGIATDADYDSLFVVTAEPIAVDAIGLAYIAGLVPVLVRFGSNDGPDWFATPIEGDSRYLRSHVYGRRIIHRHPSGGSDDEHWCYVDLSDKNAEAFWGVATEAGVGDVTGLDFKFATGVPGSLVPFGEETHGIYLPESGVIEEDDELIVTRIGRKFLLSTISCPVPEGE